MTRAYDKTTERGLPPGNDEATFDSTAKDVSHQGELLRRRLQSRLFELEVEPVRLGRFTLLETVGAGGMGVVHLGYDEVLDRRVAVKLIRRLHSASPEARERLFREARAMARLSHPNVVQIFEAGEYNGAVFIAMEYVAGQTLRQWLEESKRSVAECVAVFVAAGRGLDAAHAAKVIHRDFKPDNVLITKDGTPKVTDFGLAGFGQLDDASEEGRTSAGNESLIQTGAMLGTPGYMPPEQFAAGPTDGRSDQFSFCVALYEAVYGQAPFEGSTPESIACSVTNGELRAPPSNVGVPRRIANAIERGLAVDPAQRWPSMSALLNELQPPARRQALGIGIGVGALALAAAIVATDDADPCTGAGDEIAPAWSPARRDAIEEAVAANDADFATASWQRVAPRLDAYAEAWAEQHHDACRATRHGSQSEAMLDRRMACLSGRRAALHALADEIATGTNEALAVADELVEQLPTLALCADIEALQDSVPPPEAGAQAEAVEQTELVLAESIATRSAGRDEEALAIAERAVTHAQQSEYEPILARAELARGAALKSLQRPSDAIAALETSLEIGLRLGQWDVAFSSILNLGSALAVTQTKYAEARRLWDIAAGMVDRVGPHARVQLRVFRAAALTHEGRFAEAQVDYEAAIADLEANVDGREVQLVETFINFADSLCRASEYERSIATTERGVEVLRAAVGEGHPLEAKLAYTRSFAEEELGMIDAAEEHHRAAIELATATTPNHPLTATYDVTYPALAMHRGALAEAERGFVEALARWEPKLGADHSILDVARCDLGIVQARLGKPTEAEAALRRCLVHDIEVYGKDHPRTAEARDRLAGALVMLQRFEEAEEQYRLALDALGEEHAPDSLRIAEARASHAGALLDLQRSDEAEQELRAALFVLRAKLPPSSPKLGYTLTTLASLLQAKGDLEGALVAYRESWVAFAASLGDEHQHVAYVASQIGGIEMALERIETAVTTLQRAADLYAKIEAPPADRAYNDFRLALARYRHGQHAQGLALGRATLADIETMAGTPGMPELAQTVRAWLADPTKLPEV